MPGKTTGYRKDRVKQYPVLSCFCGNRLNIFVNCVITSYSIHYTKLYELLLISGALGLFDKEIVINCGGYYTKTVGEDMELVVRIRITSYNVCYTKLLRIWSFFPTTVAF